MPQQAKAAPLFVYYVENKEGELKEVKVYGIETIVKRLSISHVKQLGAATLLDIEKLIKDNCSMERLLEALQDMEYVEVLNKKVWLNNINTLINRRLGAIKTKKTKKLRSIGWNY